MPIIESVMARALSSFISWSFGLVILTYPLAVKNAAFAAASVGIVLVSLWLTLNWYWCTGMVLTPLAILIFLEVICRLNIFNFILHSMLFTEIFKGRDEEGYVFLFL